MYDVKTKVTDASVEAYLSAIEPDQKQADCREIAGMMTAATGLPPKMWGSSIVGFGKYHYRYDSGHEGDAARIAFSSRTRNITLYITGGFDSHRDLLDRLGRYKIGKGCLYITALAEVDRVVLEELIRRSVDHVDRLYPA